MFVDERAAPSASLSQSGSRLSHTIASLDPAASLISVYISGETGQASEFVQPGRPSDPGQGAVPAASQFTP